MTSLLRQSDVIWRTYVKMTSFWRNNDVMITSCVQGVVPVYWQRSSLRLVYPWWRQQMETFSALLALCAGNSLHWSPVNSPHKGQWLGDLMFSLNSTWINGWANNREAGDLRRHRAHYDVTVMLYSTLFSAIIPVCQWYQRRLIHVGFISYRRYLRRSIPHDWGIVKTYTLLIGHHIGIVMCV